MGSSGVTKILNLFVKVIGMFDKHARFLEALGGIVVGIMIL